MIKQKVPRLPFGNRLTSRNLLGLSVAGVALGTLVVISFGSTTRPDCQDMDFGAYYRASAAVARGESPYIVDEHGPLGSYAYAPIYAYLCIPLSRLDYLWACRLWMAVNWAATIAGCWLVVRLVCGEEERLRHTLPGLALALLASGAYLWTNLHMGQVAMLMFLGCLGWAWCQRHGKPFLGGLALATACALKVAPAVLLPYLVLRRDFRGLAGVAVGAAALFLVPAAWVDWDGTVQLHREWIGHTAATQIPAQTCRRGNQSLLAQLARLPGISCGDVCTAPDKLAILSRWYPFVLAGLGGIVYAWSYRALRRSGAGVSVAQRENLVLAVLFIFLTLAHPRAWRCNFVALLFPCLLLAERRRRRLPGAFVDWAALGLMVLACVWPTRALEAEDWTLSGWLLLGKHFWAALAVGFACLRGAASSVPGGPAALAGAARFSSAWYAPGSKRDTRRTAAASTPAE
jgi:Glycosyltransferase family 87